MSHGCEKQFIKLSVRGHSYVLPLLQGMSSISHERLECQPKRLLPELGQIHTSR